MTSLPLEAQPKKPGRDRPPSCIKVLILFRAVTVSLKRLLKFSGSKNPGGRPWRDKVEVAAQQTGHLFIWFIYLFILVGSTPSRACTQDPEIQTWAEIKSQIPKRLSHPGVPIVYFIWCTDVRDVCSIFSYLIAVLYSKFNERIATNNYTISCVLHVCVHVSVFLYVCLL